MTEPTILWHSRPPLPKIPTVIVECCREWVVAVGGTYGRCGICGERPTYKGPDPDSPDIQED